MKFRRNPALVSANKYKEQSTEQTFEAGNMHWKRRIRRFALPFLLLFGLLVVSYMDIFNRSEVEIMKSKRIDSFQRNWFNNKLNFSDIGKPIGVDDCTETVNVYIQFVLEDQQNLNLTNHLNNLILSMMRKTNCNIHFYVLSNELGRDVMGYMMSVFEDRYDWFSKPVIRFIDYYNTSRDAVQYTMPMKVDSLPLPYTILVLKYLQFYHLSSNLNLLIGQPYAKQNYLSYKIQVTYVQ